MNVKFHQQTGKQLASHHEQFSKPRNKVYPIKHVTLSLSIFDP